MLFTAARQRTSNFRSCDALHEALNEEAPDIFKFPGLERYRLVTSRNQQRPSASILQMRHRVT